MPFSLTDEEGCSGPKGNLFAKVLAKKEAKATLAAEGRASHGGALQHLAARPHHSPALLQHDVLIFVCLSGAILSGAILLEGLWWLRWWW